MREYADKEIDTLGARMWQRGGQSAAVELSQSRARNTKFQGDASFPETAEKL